MVFLVLAAFSTTSADGNDENTRLLPDTDDVGDESFVDVRGFVCKCDNGEPLTSEEFLESGVDLDGEEIAVPKTKPVRCKTAQEQKCFSCNDNFELLELDEERRVCIPDEEMRASLVTTPDLCEVGGRLDSCAWKGEGFRCTKRYEDRGSPLYIGICRFCKDSGFLSSARSSARGFLSSARSSARGFLSSAPKNPKNPPFVGFSRRDQMWEPKMCRPTLNKGWFGVDAYEVELGERRLNWVIEETKVLDPEGYPIYDMMEKSSNRVWESRIDKDGAIGQFFAVLQNVPGTMHWLGDFTYPGSVQEYGVHEKLAKFPEPRRFSSPARVKVGLIMLYDVVTALKGMHGKGKLHGDVGAPAIGVAEKKSDKDDDETLFKLGQDTEEFVRRSGAASKGSDDVESALQTFLGFVSPHQRCGDMTDNERSEPWGSLCERIMLMIRDQYPSGALATFPQQSFDAILETINVAYAEASKKKSFLVTDGEDRDLPAMTWETKHKIFSVSKKTVA